MVFNLAIHASNGSKQCFQSSIEYDNQKPKKSKSFEYLLATKLRKGNTNGDHLENASSFPMKQKKVSKLSVPKVKVFRFLF